MRPGLYIGTSGWSYDVWRDNFYAGVPRRDWLRHYAEHFDAVEINASFYGSLRASTLERWRQEAPAGFRFTLKAHRYLTHVMRLTFPPEALGRQRSLALTLADALSVVVWQLPAGLHLDPPRLQNFATMLRGWPETRHALEFRHPSWFTPETAACLSENALAVCQSDAADWPLWDAVTTDLVYLRLHGHERTYASAYPLSILEAWATRIECWLAEGLQVHVYFDNTDAGHAPRDAARLRLLLGERIDGMES
jgi:uncharacterized protein YecE (DUF72 family)